MPKVICKIPNATSPINDVGFHPHPLGMISEEISVEQARRFVRIKGYVLDESATPAPTPAPTPSPSPVPAPTPAPAPADDENDENSRHRLMLIGSSVLPSLVEIAEGKTVQLGDVVGAAHAASGLSIEEWNSLADDDREQRLAAQVETMKADVAKQAQEAAAADAQKAEEVATLDKLRARAKELKIKNAHVMGAEKLTAAIAEAEKKPEADKKAEDDKKTD
jgi:hypothetical protein